MSLAISRRRLLQSIALVGLPACTGESSKSGARGSASMALDPTSTLDRRLERATFGVTPALAAEVARVGFDTWLDHQIAMPPNGSDRAFAEMLEPINRRVPTLMKMVVETQPDRDRLTDLCYQTLTTRVSLSAAFAPDQLRQRVVDCLADLLHISNAGQPEMWGAPDYDALLRKMAFGRYSDLLLATAKHPAMLLYLNQETSRADGTNVPNENYSRELMELQTVGVHGGYDDTDVVEVAHVLSGWSEDPSIRDYRYRPDWHDLGPMARGGDIMGWTPGSLTGEAAGRSLLDFLARHESTQRRIAHIFAKRFVSEDLVEDDPFVLEAAEVYRTSDTSIAQLVRHLLTSDRFENKATLMVRRPIDLIASTMRVGAARFELGEADHTLQAFFDLHEAVGQVPYFWTSPDGYPWGSAVWSNAGSLIGRWNAMVTLASSPNRLGVVLDPHALGATTPAGAVDILCGPARQVF